MKGGASGWHVARRAKRLMVFGPQHSSSRRNREGSIRYACWICSAARGQIIRSHVELKRDPHGLQRKPIIEPGLETLER